MIMLHQCDQKNERSPSMAAPTRWFRGPRNRHRTVHRSTSSHCTGLATKLESSRFSLFVEIG
jgi:hypothetical protein